MDRRKTHTGHDFVLDVAHDFVPLLSLVRRLFGDEVAQVARLDGRRDAPLAHRLHVLGDVVDHFAAALSEFLAVHVDRTQSMGPRDAACGIE